MKLILPDGAEIALTNFTSNAFLVQAETALETFQIYDTIVRGMEKVDVQDDDGNVIYTAQGLTSDGMQITPNDDGYGAIYYFHGAKAMTVEDEYSQVGKILMGVES